MNHAIAERLRRASRPQRDRAAAARRAAALRPGRAQPDIVRGTAARKPRLSDGLPARIAGSARTRGDDAARRHAFISRGGDADPRRPVELRRRRGADAVCPFSAPPAASVTTWRRWPPGSASPTNRPVSVSPPCSVPANAACRSSSCASIRPGTYPSASRRRRFRSPAMAVLPTLGRAHRLPKPGGVQVQVAELPEGDAFCVSPAPSPGRCSGANRDRSMWSRWDAR